VARSTQPFAHGDVEARHHGVPVAFAVEHVRVGEPREVLGDGALRPVERLGDGVHRRGLRLLDRVQHFGSRGVCHGRVDRTVVLVRGHWVEPLLAQSVFALHESVAFEDAHVVPGGRRFHVCSRGRSREVDARCGFHDVVERRACVALEAVPSTGRVRCRTAGGGTRWCSHHARHLAVVAVCRRGRIDGRRGECQGEHERETHGESLAAHGDRLSASRALEPLAT